MDKISELLQEAKPLYLKKQREKRILWQTSATLCLLFAVWFVQPQKTSFDDDGFDNYFTALYLNDIPAVDEQYSDGNIPLDRFGLYEV